MEAKKNDTKQKAPRAKKAKKERSPKQELSNLKKLCEDHPDILKYVEWHWNFDRECRNLGDDVSLIIGEMGRSEQGQPSNHATWRLIIGYRNSGISSRIYAVGRNALKNSHVSPPGITSSLRGTSTTTVKSPEYPKRSEESSTMLIYIGFSTSRRSMHNVC